MRSSDAEIGACCVGASEALTVGPAWVRGSAAGSIATSGAGCDGTLSAPEPCGAASTDDVPALESEVAGELLPVMATSACGSADCVIGAAALTGVGCGVGGRLPIRAACAACANSPVVVYRSSGFLAIPLATTSSNACGTPLLMAEGRGGGVVRCPATCCSTLCPGNGSCPVKHWCSTHASEYTSER